MIYDCSYSRIHGTVPVFTQFWKSKVLFTLCLCSLSTSMGILWKLHSSLFPALLTSLRAFEL